ncbi:PREDICTED: B3 domain-containing [Prunus dulcis]|uniref:PREDICTED: B3 domain-containing n=1 Tax=Prunus dulcis TaxID=3755 RepID=A0A5E4GMC4_PRUDU|nr:PREDICTED: B3 domain-containing [Prunus dulcis]
MAHLELEKYLTKADMGRLAVPAEWLKILPPFEKGSFEVQLEATDGVGFYWQFCCSVRKEGYLKPVLQSAGWLKFVNAKDLQVGDKVVLDTRADDFRGTKIRIRAQKDLDRNGHWVDV